MTIGPEPRIRMDLMSWRRGIRGEGLQRNGARRGSTKWGRRSPARGPLLLRREREILLAVGLAPREPQGPFRLGNVAHQRPEVGIAGRLDDVHAAREGALELEAPRIIRR